MRFLFAASVSLLLGAQAQPADVTSTLPFSCVTFPPDLSEADLRLKFGDRHVATAAVPWGGAEGDYNEGTVLFRDRPEARVEILWRDRAGKRVPEWVSVRGTESLWRTPAGIALGTDLVTVEKLNRRPFRLIGLANDVQGTVMSWSGGQLAAQDGKDCRVGIRLRTASGPANRAAARIWRQVEGEREFSSGHPAMQTANPTVYELVMGYFRKGLD